MTRRHHTVYALLFALMLFGCSSIRHSSTGQPTAKTEGKNEERQRDGRKERALSHFIQGTIYEAKGEYASAILEYQDALREDPNPAIHYAISKNYSILGKHALAAQSAREAVRLDSLNITYRENLASIYMSAFQHELATREYEEIVRIDSNYLSGWYNLARLYQASKPLRALEIYERILDQNGEDWEVLFQTAEIYNSLGRYEQAADKYRRMLELDPSNKALQRQLAETFSRAGNYAEAIAILEKMLEIDPDDQETIAALGDVYLEQRQYERASELYERLLKRGDGNPEVKLRVAISYFAQVQNDSSFAAKAKPIFEEVNREVPNDWRPYWYLSILAAAEKDDSVASRYLERVTELAEWNGDAWWYLGTSYYDRGEYQKLLEAMDRAKKALPRDARVHFLLGLAYSRLDQPEPAITALRRSLELKPDDINALSALALTLDGLHRYEQSDSLYERALGIDPNSHLVLNNYSYSLAERGLQLERALDMARRAVAAEPENASYLDTIGWVYYKLGRYEEAERYIAQAVATGNASAVVYEHLGDVAFKLGQKERAAELWNQALQMNKENQALREKVARGSL